MHSKLIIPLILKKAFMKLENKVVKLYILIKFVIYERGLFQKVELLGN